MKYAKKSMVVNMEIIKSKNIGKEFFDFSLAVELPAVKEILSDIRQNGDSAVRKYAKKFDGFEGEKFEVSKKEIKAAYSKVDAKTLSAIKYSAKNISAFAKKQFEGLRGFETELNGIKLGQKIVPLSKVGCYVPGGLYPLPSTALMCAIPAKIAGVKEVIICSPKIQPVTIVAADIAGASRIFNLGGIQAIGAMAYGAGEIPKVDKIVGPGNKYVTAAKKEVYGAVGIDFIAGPSEVLIIADETANSSFVAADLLAQAEHDPNARVDLITISADFAQKVSLEVQKQLAQLKTADVASQSIQNSKIIVAPSLADAIEISNKRAPEHLEVQVKNSDKIIGQLTNYGSLFVGSYCAEVFGDYCSGTNHTLPTNGAARYTGGLSVFDFVKILTYQKADKPSQEIISNSSALASAEGLEAHKKAAEIRRE